MGTESPADRTMSRWLLAAIVVATPISGFAMAHNVSKLSSWGEATFLGNLYIGAQLFGVASLIGAVEAHRLSPRWKFRTLIMLRLSSVGLSFALCMQVAVNFNLVTFFGRAAPQVAWLQWPSIAYRVFLFLTWLGAMGYVARLRRLEAIQRDYRPDVDCP